MRFIIDAHLPRRLAQIFIDLGHEAIHTSELPNGEMLLGMMTLSWLLLVMESLFLKMRIFINHSYSMVSLPK